jgi:hypothetical protein
VTWRGADGVWLKAWRRSENCSNWVHSENFDFWGSTHVFSLTLVKGILVRQGYPETSSGSGKHAKRQRKICKARGVWFQIYLPRNGKILEFYCLLSATLLKITSDQTLIPVHEKEFLESPIIGHLWCLCFCTVRGKRTEHGKHASAICE